MFVKAIKNKIRTSLAFMLALILIASTFLTPVYANNTGKTDGDMGDAYINPDLKIGEFTTDIGLSIYLGDENFVLDNNELRLTAGLEDKTADPQYKEQMAGRTITNSYFQVLNRTMLSRVDGIANASLIYMGRGMQWKGVGYVQYDFETFVKNNGTQDFINRVVWAYGSAGTNRASKTNNTGLKAYRDWYDGKQSCPSTSGVYLDKITEFINGYFTDPVGYSKTPEMFITSLLTGADKEAGRADLAWKVWSYIADGIPAANGGNLTSGPVDRWNQVFYGSKTPSSEIALNWNNIYIGDKADGDAKEGIYHPDGTAVGSWDSDTDGKQVVAQIATYLDSLMSLAAMMYREADACTNTTEADAKRNVADKYMSAAISTFNGGGNTPVEAVENMQANCSIILGGVVYNNLGGKDKANRGMAGDFHDYWMYYINKYTQSRVSIDPRSSNPLYNDFGTPYGDNKVRAFQLENSPTYVNWSSYGVVANRATWRVSTLPGSEGNAAKHESVTIGRTSQPAMAGYGPTSTLVGKRATLPTTNTPTAPPYATAVMEKMGALATYPSVGGEFIIGMFAHATFNDEALFTHSLTAVPKEFEEVEPSTAGVLNRAPTVTYRFGNTFAPSGDGKLIAASSPLDAKEILESLTNLMENSPQGKGTLEIRTYLTRQITRYDVQPAFASGDPGAGTVLEKSVVSFDEVSLDTVRTKSLGNYLVTPKSSFNSTATGWAPLEFSQLKAHLEDGNQILIEIEDVYFRDISWPAILPDVIMEGSGALSTVYARGADYILSATYRADTEVRLRFEDGTYHTISYPTSAENTSVPRAVAAYGKPAGELPVFLTQSKPGVFSPVEDKIGYEFHKKPSVVTLLNKPPLQYAVYSSSPEAYAELKNWGVATRNEPGDSTNRGDAVPLGDNRSPVDTGAGVSESWRSDGAQLITEDYEAMSGVPTTEKLYLAVGGSEFITDIAVQYVPNETAIRSYKSYFASVRCQHFWNGDAGTASGLSDTPYPAHFGTPPQASGAGNPSVSWSTIGHGGYSITVNLSGSIANDASAVTALHSATCVAQPNGGDVANYNSAMTTATTWVNSVMSYIRGIPAFTSTSDKVSRAFSETLSEALGVNRSDNGGGPSGTGSLSFSFGQNFVMQNDGREQPVTTVTISGSMSSTNPATTSASVGCSASETTPCGNEMATASPSPTTNWTGSFTITIMPHVICGPCCGHILPEINDIWQQSFNYDYVKIIGLSVLRLDQGSAADLTRDQQGLTALIGVSKMGVTRQTFYSSPSYNIAQANIFNYMGLQTDGTKNVNDATNEYFRSIAYGRTVATTATSDGSATSYGQTYSSEAGRVRYFITNAGGGVVTTKGTEKYRAEYQGNVAKQSPYADEIAPYDKSNGLYNAHDFVEYNFGNRSNLCDGTSRGYTHNIKKGAWVEKINGVWRGKAAHALAWGVGFIYDGIQSNGTIPMSGASLGYSADRQYRNSGSNANFGGIIQEGAKGWPGKGVAVPASTASGANTVKVYDEWSEERFNDVKWWTTGSMANLSVPIVRDWNWEKTGSVLMRGEALSGGFHDIYRDTRGINTDGGGGNSRPGAERGEVAPRARGKIAWELQWRNASQIPDTLAQSQPYNPSDGSFLTAYASNTLSNNGTKNKATMEYQLMYAKRMELVQATVISDALIFELPNGNQPILYHYKNAPSAVRADMRIPDTRVTFEDAWLSNPFAAAGWQAATGESSKDAVIIGGYNGVLGAQLNTQDLQSRYHWRADLVPTTPIGLFFERNTAVELPTGVVGQKRGAIVSNGTNINKYMGHNEVTRILSTYILNEKSASPVQRTMLYNISPIVLSALNEKYTPGNAEVFWETVMLWKDSSNHDYYGRFIEQGSGRYAYLQGGEFIRLPELLGNYGQIARDAEVHTADRAKSMLNQYFLDSRNLIVYGASQARAAQMEQYSRGFGITDYNYNDKSNYNTKATTSNVTVANKLHSELYNESADLTGELKGSPYGTSTMLSSTNSRMLGLPFILDTVYEPTFNSLTAMNTTTQRHIGDLRADTPKSGYIQRAAYTKAEGVSGVYKLNDVIIHTPISARAVQLMPIADWRDQRVYGQSQIAALRESERLGCPGTVALCKFAKIACSYSKIDEFLNLDFTLAGTANTGLATDIVKNTGSSATPQGNITLSGNYRRSADGLTSGGSARVGVLFSSIGMQYQQAMNVKVTATGIKYVESSTQREQMLFGFSGYGITVDTKTGELYIRVAGKTGYLKVNGTLAASESNTLVVEFGMSNASVSKVWINGAACTLGLVGTTAGALEIGSGEVGGVFYVGAWNSAGYVPAATTTIRSISLEQLGGSTSHDMSCSSQVMRHVGGFNEHVHTVECLGSSTSKSYLNGSISDWASGLIDDDELKKRLGDTVWNALQSMILNGGTPIEFNYTGSTQTYTPSRSGLYTVEVWGAQGGSNGGLGGYAVGDVFLNAGVPITVQVGGQGNIAGTYQAAQPGGAYLCNNLPLNTGGTTYCWTGLRYTTNGNGSNVLMCNNRLCHYGSDGVNCTIFDNLCAGAGWSCLGHTAPMTHAHNSNCVVSTSVPASYSGSGGGGYNGGGNGYSQKAQAGAYTCNNLPLNSGGTGGLSCTGQACMSSGGHNSSVCPYGHTCSGCNPCHNDIGTPHTTHVHNTSCGQTQAVAGINGYGGGGATHIAISGGTLNSVTKSNVIIVAGGGGGSIVRDSGSYTGGSGGGDSGVAGSGASSPAGGTQNAGGAGQGTGGSAPSTNGGGGGGGWYGGYAAVSSSGGGGSGYKSAGLITPISYFSTSMQTGVRTGNGYAKITPERGFIEYKDVIELHGGEAWKTIPYYIDGAENERNPVWACDLTPNRHVCLEAPNPNACYTEIDYSTCQEPHHTGGHYAGSSICYQPCMNDNLHDTQFVQDRNINSAAAEWVSLDWDFTLYASTIDNTFRAGTHYQLDAIASTTGRGYYDQNNGMEFDTVKFARGKYVKFPWDVLYDGVLYWAGTWIVLGERGDYAQGYVDNVKDGIYGRQQGSATKANNVWNGQAAAYNVENWSLYNTKIYHDLYKDFYDFYIPLANDEMSAARVIYSVVAVNAPESRSGSDERISIGYPTALSEAGQWMNGGRVNNHIRTANSTPYGSSKQFRVDLVGRIGGYVIQDTTDVKFSNTMKDVRDTSPVGSVDFTLDLDNLQAVAGHLPAAGSLPARVGLTSLGDWVGFDYNVDNNRNFTMTVSGNFLKAGVLEVVVGDAHNGDYTLRISDMTVTQASDNNLTVQFEAKPSEASLILSVRFRLLDPSVSDVYVSSMSLHYGGSGYSHGLSKTVNSDSQNYYVTDLVDVRGVFIERTLNWVGFPTEGMAAYGVDAPNYAASSSSNSDTWGIPGAYIPAEEQTLLEWYRYAWQYQRRENPNNPYNWIRLSDATQVRSYEKVRVATNPDGSGIMRYEWDVSSRETPVYGTRAVNTYGTRLWVQEKDPTYVAWKYNGGRALHGPLSADYNVIEQYRTPNDQVSIGSHILFDVTTLGNYYSANSRLEIIPSYYAINLQRNADGSTETILDSSRPNAITLTPLDIYQMTSAGEYGEVNIFGAPYSNMTAEALDKFNRYRLDVNWENEAITNFNRRNVNDREHRAARQYSDMFRMPIYDEGMIEQYLETEEWDAPIGQTESWRLYPRGIIPIGGSQLVSQDYRTQTYIGTNETYGVDKSGGLFDGFVGNELYGHPRYIVWEISAQRWHTAIGLPSDSIFVPLSSPCICGHCPDYDLCNQCVSDSSCERDFGAAYTHAAKTDIQSKAIDVSQTTIIVYLDIFSYGDVWTLRYGADGLGRSMWIGDQEYILPPDGPVGPGGSESYDPEVPGGVEPDNPGLPFVLFGGSKVRELADIIKVN